MNNDINLVSPEGNLPSKSVRRIERFKLIATIAIISVGFLSVILFVANRFFSPEGIIKQQNEIITSMLTLKDRQAKALVLNQRMNDISAIIKNRSNYDVVLSHILSTSPIDVSVTSLSIDKKKMAVVVSSSSLLSLNDFIELLKGMVEKKQFLKNVTINNLTLNGRSSGYVLTLDMELL